MPRKIGVLLSDPNVIEARRRFERNYYGRGREPKLSFDEFFELFRLDCVTFREIGRTLKMHHHAIVKIYQKYFADIFPNRPTGRRRRKACFIKRRKSVAKELPVDTVLREIAELALVNGCNFEQVPFAYNPSRFKKRSLLIKSRLCRVHYLTRLFSPNPGCNNHYCHVHFRLRRIKGFDFVIVAQRIDGYPNRTFVFPTTMLLEFYTDKTFDVDLYIPLGEPVRSSSRGRVVRINFDQYEDAWHLLDRGQQ